MPAIPIPPRLLLHLQLYCSASNEQIEDVVIDAIERRLRDGAFDTAFAGPSHDSRRATGRDLCRSEAPTEVSP